MREEVAELGQMQVFLVENPLRKGPVAPRGDLLDFMTDGHEIRVLMAVNTPLADKRR